MENKKKCMHEAGDKSTTFENFTFTYLNVAQKI